jgi:hypothetical protein
LGSVVLSTLNQKPPSCANTEPLRRWSRGLGPLAFAAMAIAKPIVDNVKYRSEL